MRFELIRAQFILDITYPDYAVIINPQTVCLPITASFAGALEELIPGLLPHNPDVM
jgi:hypothetical protein